MIVYKKGELKTLFIFFYSAYKTGLTVNYYG